MGSGIRTHDLPMITNIKLQSVALTKTELLPRTLVSAFVALPITLYISPWKEELYKPHQETATDLFLFTRSLFAFLNNCSEYPNACRSYFTRSPIAIVRQTGMQKDKMPLLLALSIQFLIIFGEIGMVQYREPQTVSCW